MADQARKYRRDRRSASRAASWGVASPDATDAHICTRTYSAATVCDACVIGSDVEDAFFPNQDPVGQQLRVGPIGRCTVVGTLVRKGNSFGQSQDMLVVLPLSAC